MSRFVPPRLDPPLQTSEWLLLIGLLLAAAFAGYAGTGIGQ